MAVAVSPETYARSFDARVAALVPEAAQRVAVFAARLRAAGLEPDELGDVEALDRLPVLGKDELMDLQAASPPFGGLLANGARLRRIFQSPGPIYEPGLDVPDPWGVAPALASAGIGDGDVVLNAASYHLSPLGSMFEEAIFALGATVIPAGVGSLELQARCCRDVGVTAYLGLPSYLKALLENAEANHLEPSSWPLERAFVTAEPLPASLRAWLEERVPVVRQGYGTADAGIVAYECEAKEGLHVSHRTLVQVCDLTSGEALWDGREGQVVVTPFTVDYPLVRLGTGDLSAFLTEPCPCGLATPRLAGWLGRVGEAVKVRGMFLHPRQAQETIGRTPGVTGFQLQIDRVDHRDVLRCAVVASDPVASDPVASGELAELVRSRIRSGLRFDADVALVDAIPKSEPVLLDRRTWD